MTDPHGPPVALDTQEGISAEIERIAARKGNEAGGPRLDYPPYRSSALRHPDRPLLRVEPGPLDLASPVFGESDVDPYDHDLTIQHRGEPLGERIVVAGRVVDDQGRPVRHQLVEIWQANASGRYLHQRDQHPAPLDPNFTGVGRCLTDAEGVYRFRTIKPGPYPWRNHHNAWRPAHIHFSLFGTALTHRLVTQMYFPGDPLFPLDPIYQSVVDPTARERLVAAYDHSLTTPEASTGYRWDITLGGRQPTWTEGDRP